MKKTRILAICISLYQFFHPAIAQDIPHFIESVGTKEGLTSNNINAIVQDDNGFLWIATSDGLDRYDGTEMVQYFHLNNKNSLPHNYVYCLKKMPNNYIAIGTQGGLGFYNCNTGTFKNFYYKHDPAMDEYNNTIVELETDRDGNLWASSRNCIYIFDLGLKLKKIISSPFTEADAVKERLKFADKILPLPNGDVLLYLYDGWHIYSFKTNNLDASKNSAVLKQWKFLNDISYPNINKYSPASHLFTVFEKYFACIPANMDSLFLYDMNGIKVSSCFFPFNKYPYVLWSQHISVIDSSRFLFLFHYTGFSIIPVTWQNNKPVLHQLSPVLFNSDQYNTALCDMQNNWWLATAKNGLQKISPYKQYFKGQSLIDKNSGEQIKSEINSLNKFNNTLWAASYGDGFFETDIPSGRQQQHRFYKTGDDIWANHVWNFHRVSDDTLWVGTQAGMFWYKISSKKFARLPAYTGKPAALDFVPVTTQFTDSHGLIWMGLGKGKGLCNFDDKNKRFTYYAGSSSVQGYPLRYPTCIAEDAHNNLWFVNDGSTVLVYWKRNTNQFQTINLPFATRKQIGNLNGIYCDGDSVLWLGSITCGLVKFNLKSNSITVYGHQNGLNNSHITSIFQDNKKRLWLADEGGLACFDEHTETFINYTPKEGLPVQYPSDYFYYDTAGNRLYAGGIGAFFYFNPDMIDFNHPPQKTYITAMKVNGKSFIIDKDQPAKLKPQQNDITIQYTAVDLTNGDETRYACKLIGEDTGWIMAGNQRQINFSHLAPGKYTFMVRAGNNIGEWSKQYSTVSFIINPPFIQTAWFYGLVLLVMGGIFYALYRFRIKQLMQTEQVRSDISKNLHDEVGANLTNISLSTLLAQKQISNEAAVNKILERIYQDSQTVSEAMREIVWSINPKIDKLGEALPRMLLYAAELLEAKNIELKAEIIPQVEQLKFSMQQRHDLYLIFKEAVNNIAKHSKAKQVMINFNLNTQILNMIIADDGKGFDASAPLVNNGLKNMNERANKHQWQLTVRSGQNAGTTIMLNAPIA